MSWPETPLGELAEFRNGLNYTRSNEGRGLRVINVKDFGSRFFPDYESLGELNPSGLARDEAMLRSGDIVFVRSNGNKDLVGRSLFVAEPPTNVSFSAFCIRARVTSPEADPKFLAYFFRSTHFRKRIALLGKGTNISNLNQQVLKSIIVPNPPTRTQERIVAILESYDDLIENNRRRIQLLEQSARLLYKEWFVHLRFPGHEHVKIEDGVPEGWESVRISSFCEVRRGGSPRPIKNFMNGTVPWFKIGDATASQSPFVYSTAERVIEDGVSKSVLLPPRELILSNSATCGVPYFTGIEGCIHDGWLYFKDLQRVDKWFLYCCLCAKQDAILQGIGEGATQKNLNTEYIGRQHVLLPENDRFIGLFSESVQPIFMQIDLLARELSFLAKARDLLLPRLMSGEISV